jgi:hypothetical protein
MSDQVDLKDLQFPDCSFNNARQGPCTQPIVGHRQPFVDPGATSATNLNAAAQFFMNPSFQAHINSFQNDNPIKNNREGDNGLQQVFQGLSTLFQALATSSGVAEQLQQGQDISNYGDLATDVDY